MEEVWLKAEPIDEKFETCFSKKCEDIISSDTIDIAAPTFLPVLIIKEEQPEAASEDLLVECVQSTEYTSSASQFTNYYHRNLTTEETGAISEKKVSQLKRHKETLSPKTSKKHRLRRPIQRKRMRPCTSYGSKNEKKSRKEHDNWKQLKEEPTAETSTKEVKKRLPKKETRNRRFCCETCGKEFNQSSHLHRHKLIHSGEKPHVCTECGRGFAQSSTLKSHQMMHTGERRFFCEECGAKFATKFYFKIHQRSHTGELPFACDECDERFNQKGSLARHKLEHTGEKRFECDECGMKFYDSKLLKSHKKTHVAGDKPFTCVECQKGFYHKTSLNAHKRSHSVERPFGCEICGKRFTQKGTLTIHKVIHSDVRPYACDICGLQFTQKFTLKTHSLKQHGCLPTAAPKRQKQVHSQPFKNAETKTDGRIDKILKENFSEESELKVEQPEDTNEMESSSSESESDDKPMDTDTLRTRSPASLESHSMLEVIVDEYHDVDEKFTAHHRGIEMQLPESKHSDEIMIDRFKEVPDTIFESTAQTNENLNVIDESKKKRRSIENVENSSIDRPFSCDKCERKFALIGALKNHQRSHRRVKNKLREPSFICDECGKLFTKKVHLRIHQRIHSDFKPYTCDVCNRSFTQMSNYKTHKRTHSGERPFSCDICEKSFARKNTLDLHTTSHTKDKLFCCNFCGKNFSYASSLKKHMLTHSGTEKVYGCDVCGKTFNEKSYIKLHLRTHTGYKPFQCDECPSKFINNNQLQQHKRHSHRTVGEPTPYQRKKMMKMMKVMNAALLNDSV